MKDKPLTIEALRKLSQEEKMDFLVNDFEEPSEIYTEKFYLDNIIIPNLNEFIQAENIYQDYKKKDGRYENYIRTAFNLAVSIDNLRAWLKLENIDNLKQNGLMLMFNIANSIKHKELGSPKNKFFKNIYSLRIKQMTPFYGIDKSLDHALRVVYQSDDGIYQICGYFLNVAKNSIEELRENMQ